MDCNLFKYVILLFTIFLNKPFLEPEISENELLEEIF